MSDLIVDFGHGGSDPGGVFGEYKEKDFTLDIGERVVREFNRQGISPKTTRQGDKTLNSNDRAKIIKNTGAKHCLSIHLNKSGTIGKGRGAETIYSKYSNGKLANAILYEIGKTGLTTRSAYSKVTNSGADYYYMHRLTGNVETVIIEACFLDNPGDLEFIKKGDNRESVARAIVKGYMGYIGKKYIEQGVKSDKLYRVQVGAFSKKENAIKMVNELKSIGYKDVFIRED